MNEEVACHDDNEEIGTGLSESQVADLQGELMFEPDACAGVQVPVTELPSRLQEVKLALENAGFKCDSRKDAATDEVFVVTPLVNQGNAYDGKPIRLYSTGRCLNLIMPTFLVTNPEGRLIITRVGEKTNWFISDKNLIDEPITKTYESITAFGISELDGLPCQVVVHNEFALEPIDPKRIVDCFKSYMDSVRMLTKVFHLIFFDPSAETTRYQSQDLNGFWPDDISSVDRRVLHLEYDLFKMGIKYVGSIDPVYYGATLLYEAEVAEPFVAFRFGVRHVKFKENSPLLLFAAMNLPDYVVEDATLLKTIDTVALINAHKAPSVAEAGVWTLANFTGEYENTIHYRLEVPEETVSELKEFESFFADVLAYGKKVLAVLSGEADFEQAFTAAADEVQEEELDQLLEETEMTSEAEVVEEIVVASSGPTSSQQAEVDEPEQAQETQQQQNNSSAYEKSQGSEEKLLSIQNAILVLISFLIPIVGIVLSWLWNKRKPKVSKILLVAALLGIAAYVFPAVS